jgi:predicted DsbA family dithiol-disulfide isomerase/uncharacterized membrane protein
VKSAPWLALIRTAALFALAASGALLADYSGLAPTFCTAGSGCAQVRQAGYGYVPGLNVPVPLLGIVAFALLLGVSLVPDERWRRQLTSVAAIVGGLIGLTLLGVQHFLVGAFCSLCVTVDVSAIAAGIFAVFYLRDEQRPPAELVTPLAWAALGTLAFLAPFYWPKVRPAPAVPPEIAKLYQPGKINVVEFADFQCPHCRRLHPRLKKLNHEYGDKVNFVRLNMPLGGHSQAKPAAIAYVCADQQGKGEAMSDALFDSPSLGPDTETRAAEALGLDLGRFQRCLVSKDAVGRVEREMLILKEAGFEGLPTTFVGSDKILGAQSEETFRAAYERAAHNVGQSGTPWPIYVFVTLGAMAAIAWFGRVRPEEPARG